MHYETEVKFLKPIGIELTFLKAEGRMDKNFSDKSYYKNALMNRLHAQVPRSIHDDGYLVWQESVWRDGTYITVTNRSQSTPWQKFSKKWGIGNLTTDPGCVEWPSPILRSWKQAQEWYEFATSHAAAVGLTPFRDGYMGGGGHIHMGKLSMPLICDMFRDMVFRPYLSWALLDPNDDINGQALLTKGYGNTYCEQASALNSQLAHVAADAPFGFIERTYEDDRCHILSSRREYETVEWRAFDSAADWSIQRQQIAIYQRYVALFLKSQYRCYGFSKDWLQRDVIDYLASWKDLNKCIRAFRDFIMNDLELPWPEYKWFVERNLEPKFKNRWSKIR